MAYNDDFDVEAMLEEPYRKDEPSSNRKERDGRNHDKSIALTSRRRDQDKDRDRDRERQQRRDRGSSRDRDRRQDRDKDRDRERNRDRDRERDRGRDDDKRSRPVKDERVIPKPRSRSRSREPSSKEERRFGRRTTSPISRKRTPSPELAPEERDQRTVFCMQLAARIRPRDLEEFFSSVGSVHDVRLILDNKSHRSKGIAYVEFREVDSVPLALGLSGQRLLGVPIIVQPSHAERNRIASAAAAAMKSSATGPMRLYVGSLHYNITEDMIRGIFEPFGKIDDLKLMKDHQTGRSAGYGFITYHNADDAKKAMDQLNGFELAGRPMKVGNVTEHSTDSGSGGSYYDIDDMDRAGFGLGATGRIQLMAKLAEGTGMQIPPAAASVLNQAHLPAATPPAAAAAATPQAAPPIATQCFMLSNMFDQKSRQIASANWETELKDDIIGECNQYGGVVHIYVDRDSEQGNVYIKSPTITAAVSSVNALHGRFYAGRVITAAYVPLPNYHSLFPDAARAMTFVMPSGSRLASATGFNR